MNKLTVIIGLCIIVIVGAAALLLLPATQVFAPTGNEGGGEPTASEPINFLECLAAGYPVMESYPRQCNTPSGGHFVEDVGNAIEVQDLIVSDFPRPGDIVSSPMVATGQARGNWFFEASFPISILDAEGEVIGTGYAEAQGEWMTTEFVPFQSIAIEFEEQEQGAEGTVVLHKDNPSGLPEHDNELRIPIVF